MKKLKLLISYKKAVIEILETLCSICLFLGSEGRRTHNKYTPYMDSHFRVLKKYSEELRKFKKEDM